jgi:ankyrin repeat protein
MENYMKKQQILSLLLLMSAGTGSFSAFGMSKGSAVSRQSQAQSQEEQVALDNDLLDVCADSDDESLYDAEQLIQRGASVNIKDKEGRTPLFLAGFSDNFPLQKLLVRNGANVNVLNSVGGTLLTGAAAANDFERVKFFVENGAKVDVTTFKGDTALGWAGKKNNSEMVKFLYEQGARE